MSKRLLQIVSAVLAAIPVLTGILGMFGIGDPLYASAGLPHSAVLDSNLRLVRPGHRIIWLDSHD